ncbi:hypothetical protein [Synechocystis sp. LKSZ1]|uniref:hypothetical protein n=1 Tax=Synechocystis sp. LKSZ1 TaxID=3144951 RepID=UPI00336BC4B6
MQKLSSTSSMGRGLQGLIAGVFWATFGLGGLTLGLENSQPALASAVAQSPASPLTLQALKNATYTLSQQGTFTLSNGTLQQGNTTLTLIPPIALGDINQDGSQDAAVILALNNGGDSTFMYLAVVTIQGNGLSNVDTYRLGDRVRVQSLSVKGGQVRVTLLRPKPTDPPCCPTDLVVEAYQLNPAGVLAPITLSESQRQQIQVEDLPIPTVAQDDDFPSQPSLGEFQIQL